MRNKLNIAYIFESIPEDGGNFQTEISSAIRLREINDENINIEFFSTNKKNIKVLSIYNFKPILLKKRNISFLLLMFYKFLTSSKIKNILKFLFGITQLENQLLKKKIDIVHFNSMSSLAMQLDKINFGVSFWDSGHLQFPQFPESRKNYHSFESKEYLYNLLLKKSSYIITDSIENKDNLLKQYNVDEKKINLIYSEPASDLLNIDEKKVLSKKEIFNKFDIKNKDYIFYPAQYWPHKNHIYILESLSILKEKYGRNLSVVFTGKNKFNNLNYIKQVTKNLNLQYNVTFKNFVESNDLFYLYKYALAITVPTYMGPTNHLPLEGFYIGTPVLYSDLWSETEQVKGAVLSFDLKDANSLSLKIIDLLEKKDLRDTMINKGKEKYNEILDKTNRSQMKLKEIFKSFLIINKNWE